MSASDIAISVRNLSKSYVISHQASGGRTSFREALTARLRSPFAQSPKETFWALKDVSFDVKKGDVLGIIGRNGAGKSTLLKILSRITKPTSGEIDIFGRVGSLLEVGTGFHPELTGRENVYLNGTILGMRRSEVRRQFDAIVDFAEVDQFLDTPVKRYSSGMYIRLAFAVAAHLNPEILIVDEVLAVGDAEFQKKCLGKMGEVATQGRTVLFVSHNLAAIQRLCASVIVMNSGRKVFAGDTADAIEHYAALSSASAVPCLTDRSDRTGKGTSRFTEISIEDDSGCILHEAETGKPINIVLDFESVGNQSLRGCRISLAINTPMGDPILLFSSELTNPELSTCPPAARIRCRIAKLPLTSGRFGITVFLMANGDIQDWVQDAAALSVRDGDFFGTGKLYPDGWQGKVVLVAHDWTLMERGEPKKNGAAEFERAK